jgi:deazaflavin-dependent oxidoreductase (nitroreductase family)
VDRRRGGLTYVDPDRRRGWLYRAYARVFGTTRPAMWFARTVLWKVDPHLLRLTGGRLSLAVGIPRALLETTGARTGVPRRHAVIYFHDGERPTIVASKFGLPEDPAWFHNVRANPAVAFGGEPYRADVVDDPEELERLWALADAVFPPFAIYRERAARTGRTIPILQLVPEDGDEAGVRSRR